MGIHFPVGVLLLGPPGTGKSLLANALSWESATPLLSCSPRECVCFTDLFARAKKTRSIILIDEIDAIEKQDLRELFIEMDKIEKNPGVIVLATNNREDPLDEALFRRGRFELVLRLEVPDTASRNAILEALVSKKRFSLGEDLNLAEIASMTTGFSGAELANVVDEAALLAAGEYRSVVGMIDFVIAVEQSTARKRNYQDMSC